MNGSSLINTDSEGLKELDTQAFVKAYGKHAALEVKEGLQAATRAKLVAVSEGIRHQAEEALQLLQTALAEAEAQGEDADPTQSMSLAFDALRLAAQLAYEVLAVTRESAPAALAEAAQLLHTHALLAMELCPAVQDAVARLCCAWWAVGGPDKEELLSQTLPFLLIRALTDTKGRACSVKPCLDMRHALGLLDFEDESIDDMKRLLLQAAKSSLFLRRPEGRRFLAHVLTLHPSLVAEVASVMRNMVVTGKQWLLEAVGEIILRGWREATGPCSAAIEATLIQGFAKACLHASSKGLASSILVVLHQLHEAKRLGPAGGGSGALDSALVRLYEPVLFRALSAANAAVRRNALLLLLDVFPLVDPDASEQEQDEALSRQLAAVADALSDPAPAVRAAAAPGACALLDCYWEIIPSATTAAFVAKLTDQLAFDAAAPGVRAAVLEGLRLLVDNVHAQPVLRRALPGLAPLLGDAAPAVRVGMADLLLTISTSRGLKFWEVVPLEALLEVLARPPAPAGDDGLTARVHHLLVPSYLPNTEEGAARVAALLRSSPAAGRAFCRLLVAPLLDGGAAAPGAGQRVPVPLEWVISLAAALASHLADHPPAADPHSPPRKTRGRRGGAAAPGAADGAAARGGGKRKKAPAAAAAAAAGQEGEGGDGSGEEAERDVLALGAQEEAAEGWCALLAGLAELAGGVGAALKAELCGEGDLEGMLAPGALQQLLDSCPAPEPRHHVWSIAEHLPCLPAAARLRANTLKQLASGQLLETYGSTIADADGAATASTSGPGATHSHGHSRGRGRLGAGGGAGGRAELEDGQRRREELRAILACLAAAPCCAKLSALLSRALGLPWGPGGGAAAQGGQPREQAAAGAGEEAAGADEQDDDDNDIACKACGKAQPDHNLLLCDGCDAAYHTTCLRPRLAAVPEGEWFCPGCDGDIRGSRLAAGGAVECLGLLLGTAPGRHLLQQSGLLASALPALQQRSTAATEAALRQLQPAAAAAAGGRGRGAGPPAARRDDALAACCEAAEAACLCARASIHLAGLALLHALVQTGDGPGAHEGACAASDAVRAAAAEGLVGALADGSSALASAADWLAGAGGGSGGSGWGDAEGASHRLGGAARRLAGGAAALLALSGDALRMGLVAASDSVGREQAAACGRSALALLVALQPCAVEGPVEDALKGDTALLRLLVAPPQDAGAAADGDGGSGGSCEQLSAWVCEWLSALCAGPLAGAAASVRPHVPALLGGLMRPSGAGAADAWLSPLAEAVAGAAVEAAGGASSGGSDNDVSDGDVSDDEDDAENADPNVQKGGPGAGDGKAAPLRRAAGGKAGGGGAGGPLEVQPLVAYFVQAAKLKKVERDVAARCVAASVAAGRAGDWRASLGALRLGRVLGAFKAGPGSTAEQDGLAALGGVRAVAAAAAKGGGAAQAHARLLAGQIERVETAAAAAAAGGRRADGRGRR